MKLKQITSALLDKAMRLYLRVAYPKGPPERVAELAQVDHDAPLEAALAPDDVEKIERPNVPGFIDKYRWRLGNEKYPHMKLGLERCSHADDFVFVVHTHDREFPVGTGASDSPEYRDLVRHNVDLKAAIEGAWHEAGVPTLRGHIAQRLRDRCFLPTRRPRTILIVDDDEDVLELEQTLLEQAGYRVLAATDALGALEHLHRSGPVDLCLLDVMMPSLDGHATARQLRRHSDLRFPILYVTALPPDIARDDVADDYVGKPFDADHLLDIIHHHLG